MAAAQRKVTAGTAGRGPKPQGRGRWQRGRCRGTKPRPPPAPSWGPPKPPQHPPSCSAPLGPCPGGGAGADPVPGTRGSAKLEGRGGEGKGGPGAARRRGDTAPTRPSPGRRPGASRSPKRLPGGWGGRTPPPDKGRGCPVPGLPSGHGGAKPPAAAAKTLPGNAAGLSPLPASRTSRRDAWVPQCPPGPGSAPEPWCPHRHRLPPAPRSPGVERSGAREEAEPPARPATPQWAGAPRRDRAGAAPRGHGAGRGEALAPARDVPEAPQGSLNLPSAPLLPRQRERPKGQQPGAALSALSSLSESGCLTPQRQYLPYL